MQGVLRLCAAAGMIAAAFIALPQFVGTGAHAAELPQDHEYQRVLRAHLATLGEQDFAVRLAPIDFRDRWLREDDDLYRMWVLAQSFPTTKGLTLPARSFMLATIESPDGIRMRAGGRGGLGVPGLSVDPMDLCWWSTWNFRGNPYFNLRAVRNRAFVIAAVDMMMLDHLHESGTHWVNNARRSDFLGGTLVWLSYVYLHAKQDLPPEVRDAYEAGLSKLVGRLNEWGPTRVTDNMDTRALIAAAYLSRAVGDRPLAEDARRYCGRVLQVFHPAGIVRDAGGVEASYNGIALFNLTWATAVTEWPELRAMQRRVSVLKSLLTLPEPDGCNFWGPSHFSSRTGADSANDQWAFPPRDIALAMREPAAEYLAFGGRHPRLPLWAVPEPRTMSGEIGAAISRLNADRWTPSTEEFPTWVATWWSSGSFNFAYDHYVPGFYGRLRQMQRSNDPLALPPLLRGGDPLVRVFPTPGVEGIAEGDRNTFAIVRFPRYAAIVYTGPLGWHGYMNFGGGALSAFWTPAAGAAILGRTGNPVPAPDNPQTWQSWRSWPTHAVSGQTPSGDAFSSARIRRRVAKVDYDLRDDGILITVSGPIGRDHDKSFAAQNGCLAGTVNYSRRIGMGERGVAVETAIEGDGTDLVTALCEVIPLTLFDARTQATRAADGAVRVPHHRVFFRTEAGVVPASEMFTAGVSAIVIERFDGRSQIQFRAPQRVMLGPPWEDPYQTRMTVRNLLIDLLGSDGPSAKPLAHASVAYLITPD